MRVCIPVNDQRGLGSLPYAHFGSAPHFLLHDIQTGETRVMPNGNAHHAHGQCRPLQALAGERVDVILVGGIGAGAYAKLKAAGIRVFLAQNETVQANLDALRDGRLAEFSPATVCRGHAHAHVHGHGHGHAPG